MIQGLLKESTPDRLRNSIASMECTEPDSISSP
jgi:hypothetical protein